jgi:N-acetylglucosamine-6-phosphate deacetylase
MPAKLAGVESDLGSLEPGKQADIALLDKELKVVATYIGGEKVFER